MIDPNAKDSKLGGLEIAMQFGDQFAKAVSDFKKQWTDALAPLQAVAEKYRAAFEVLQSQLAEANIAAGLKKLDSAFDAVNSAGWTIPGWLPMHECLDLCGKSSEEVNAYLFTSFAENDFERLQKLEAELL